MLLAQRPESRIEEFAQDPILTVACVLLIFVSLAWIVASRLIVRNLKRAAVRARRRGRRPPPGAARPPRDIWSYPP